MDRASLLDRPAGVILCAALCAAVAGLLALPGGAGAQTPRPPASTPVPRPTNTPVPLTFTLNQTIPAQLWAAPGETISFRVNCTANAGPLRDLVRDLVWQIPGGGDLPGDSATLQPVSTAATVTRTNCWADELAVPADLAVAAVESSSSVLTALYTVRGTDGQGRERSASAQLTINVEVVPAEPAAPVLAWYYAQFAQGPAQDAANMQKAGIDTVILSQTGYQIGRPLSTAPIVQALRGTNLTFTVGIETNVVYPSQQHLINELRRLITEEVGHPRFLRYRGRPVLIFWALPQIPLVGPQTPQQAWDSVREQVDPQRTTIWIGEGGDVTPGTGTMTFMPTFDGLHLYSIAWDEAPERALAGWERRLRAADRSKLWVATVMPGGFYGAGIVPREQWSYRDRQGGGFLTRAWQGAIVTTPAMVILTSWNETNENTEIHPTDEWASTYVDIMRQQGDRWRGTLGLPPFVELPPRSAEDGLTAIVATPPT